MLDMSNNDIIIYLSRLFNVGGASLFRGLIENKINIFRIYILD